MTTETNIIITPKAKAEELWSRYYAVIDDRYPALMAKLYASMAVELLIDELAWRGSSDADFWREVKSEIWNLRP
jgi:hypothetical protein